MVETKKEEGPKKEMSVVEERQNISATTNLLIKREMVANAKTYLMGGGTSYGRWGRARQYL